MSNRASSGFLLKKRETEDMFNSYIELAPNCFPIMNDLMNGLIRTRNKTEVLEILCEYVSACKLTKEALRQIFKEENKVEGEKYQVDNMQVETLKASWTLLRSINFELSSINLSLSKH